MTSQTERSSSPVAACRRLAAALLAVLLLASCSSSATPPPNKNTSVPVIFDDEEAVVPFMPPDLSDDTLVLNTPRPSLQPTPSPSVTPTASATPAESEAQLPTAGSSREGILKVQAAAPAVDGFSFAFLGDSRNSTPFTTGGEENYERTIQLINRQGVRFALHGGDFTFDNLSRHWKKVQEIHKQLRVPLITVVGNHDTLFNRSFYESNYVAPNADTGLDDYSFDYGNARFVALDNANFTFTDKQFEWMDEQLRTDKVKIVSAHAPPRIGNWAGHAMKDAKVTQRWLEILERREVHLVLVSHIHLFDDSVKRGRTQFVLSGGAGAPLSPQRFGNSLYHIVVVRLEPSGKLSYRMVPVN